MNEEQKEVYKNQDGEDLKVTCIAFKGRTIEIETVVQIDGRYARSEDDISGVPVATGIFAQNEFFMFARSVKSFIDSCDESDVRRRTYVMNWDPAGD